MAAEKRITSKLLDIRRLTEKMYKIDDHVAYGLSPSPSIHPSLVRVTSPLTLTPSPSHLQLRCGRYHGRRQYSAELRAFGGAALLLRLSRANAGRAAAASAVRPQTELHAVRWIAPVRRQLSVRRLGRTLRLSGTLWLVVWWCSGTRATHEMGCLQHLFCTVCCSAPFSNANANAAVVLVWWWVCSCTSLIRPAITAVGRPLPSAPITWPLRASSKQTTKSAKPLSKSALTTYICRCRLSDPSPLCCFACV